MKRTIELRGKARAGRELQTTRFKDLPFDQRASSVVKRQVRGLMRRSGLLTHESLGGDLLRFT